MGRPLEGSKRRRGTKVLASVPDATSTSGRREYSFDDDPSADAWIAESLARRRAGLPPAKPQRTPRSVVVTRQPQTIRGPLGPAARAWHSEHYEEMLRGGADRSSDVARDLENHIIVVFDALTLMPYEEARDLVKAWLRTMSGRKPKGADFGLTPATPPYAYRTVAGLLEILRMVLAHMRLSDPTLPDYTVGLGALKPVGKEKPAAPIVSIAMTARIAAHLHVIHQLVLWLIRLGGLRISEVFGLRVAHFFDDDEKDNGLLVVGDQGGKAFATRDDDGEVHQVFHKEQSKTSSGRRLIMLCPQLTVLVRTVIEVFHTAPDGTVDFTARLVPTIRSICGGQSGFRSALKRAVAAVGGVSDDPDDYVVPHDLRKNFASDLGWSDEISELLARRLMGHRAGKDVFATVYTLDRRLAKDLIPGAKVMEDQVAEAGLDHLMVPTAERPLYGTDVDSTRVARVDAMLEELAWLRPEVTDALTVAEAAAQLSRTEHGVRRLVTSGILAATKRDGRWWVDPEAVATFAKRFEGISFLPLIADEAAVPYGVARRTMDRLGITPEMDPYSRTLLLTDADAARVAGELARVKALRQRSMTIPDAAAALSCAKHTVERWVAAGRLELDLEGDGGPSRYVTRASVTVELEKRTPRRRATVTVVSFTDATGITEEGVQALVREGMLVRARAGHLTDASVRAWVTGYRPDLLGNPIVSGRSTDHSSAVRH